MGHYTALFFGSGAQPGPQVPCDTSKLTFLFLSMFLKNRMTASLPVVGSVDVRETAIDFDI